MHETANLENQQEEFYTLLEKTYDPTGRHRKRLKLWQDVEELRLKSSQEFRSLLVAYYPAYEDCAAKIEEMRGSADNVAIIAEWDRMRELTDQFTEMQKPYATQERDDKLDKLASTLLWFCIF